MPRWLTLAFCLVLAAPALLCAQPSPSPTPPSATSPAPPIMQFLLAAAVLALIIAIMCMPTRKSR
jgi:hypothetical protein